MPRRSDSDMRVLEQELVRIEEERIEMFERLRVLETERTERAIDLFTMIAHELHTPLQSLLMGTDSLAERIRNTADELPREWLLDRVEQQRRTVGALSEVIRALVSVAELRAGTMPLVRQRVDLAAMARTIVDRHGVQLDWARCHTTVDEVRQAVGHWDGTRLDLVLSSLLSNAMKYGAGQPIAVIIDGDDRSATLAVRDHGIGIDRADHARIFDRFERVAPSNVPGFGLGLWMARSLLRDVGGNIAVESEPGAGATFTVRLPRAA